MVFNKGAKKIVFSTYGTGTTGLSTCTRTKLIPYLTPCVKMNSKWITDLHFRVKIIKLLEEYTGINLCDVESGIDFFDVTKSTGNKRKKLALIKIKNSCTSKIASRKQKDSPRNGGKCL